MNLVIIVCLEGLNCSNEPDNPYVLLELSTLYDEIWCLQERSGADKRNTDPLSQTNYRLSHAEKINITFL